MAVYIPETSVFISLLRHPSLENPNTLKTWDWLRAKESQGDMALTTSFASYVQVILSSQKAGTNREWEKALAKAEGKLDGPEPWSLSLNSILCSIYANARTNGYVDKVELLELIVYATAVYNHFTLLVFEKHSWLELLHQDIGLEFDVVQL